MTSSSSRNKATDPVPPEPDIDSLRKAAGTCKACPLYLNATQTVFGEGAPNASLFIIGEQPGDNEDREGRAFVGPAGHLLDRALEEVGIDRQRCYLTNAVKHFKWELKGKRRLHKKPSSREIAACRPWLAAELQMIQPEIILCLGATAVRSLFGNQVRVLRDRGEILQSEFSNQTLVTIHPSSLLRVPDRAARKTNYALFLRDLRRVAALLHTRNH